jgi:hypothetical protein
MSYIGDMKEDQAFDFTFSTRDTTGTPSSLSGTPALEVYKGSGVTPSGEGVTLTADFNSTVGLNHVHIETSGTFYEIANDYHIVILSGTVDGVSVSGETVGLFSIENRFDEVDVVKIDGDTTAALRLKQIQASGIIFGSASGSPTTTSMPTDLTEVTDNHYRDGSVVWLTGVLAGQRKPITGYTGADKSIQYKQTTDAPASGDIFMIV